MQQYSHPFSNALVSARLQELRIECFFLADASTRQTARQLLGEELK